VSTPELIEAIGAALGRRPRLLPIPPAWLRLAGRTLGRESAVERLLGSLELDSSRIERVLGWTPPHAMAEGLAETVAWWRQSRRGWSGRGRDRYLCLPGLGGHGDRAPLCDRPRGTRRAQRQELA